MLAAHRRRGPALRRHQSTSTSPTSATNQAKDIRGEIEGKGLAICGLGFYPNPLHPDPALRDPVIAHLKLVIDACRKMGVPFMNTFMGGDAARTSTRTGTEALKVWPDIVKHARDNGVKSPSRTAR